VPQGIRNAAFNLLELPPILPGPISLNTWMGFAIRWGGYRAVVAAIVENGIRITIPIAVYGAYEAAQSAGQTVLEAFDIENLDAQLESGPDLMDLDGDGQPE
jgi:hypothetical protein